MDWLNALRQFDFQLFQWVNGWAGRREWLDVLGIFVSEYLIYLMGALVLLTVVRLREKKTMGAIMPSVRNWFFPSGMPKGVEEINVSSVQRKRFDAVTFFSALLAAGGGYLLRVLLSDYFGRVRPFSRAIDVRHLSSNLTDASFPSGHSTVAFALAFSIAFAHPGRGWFLLFLSALVAIGRVYTGVHYPADVIGGLVLGFLSALLSRLLVQAVARVYNAKVKMQKSKLQSQI